MKKTKFVSLVLFIGVVLLLSSCASTAQTTLTEKYSDRFEQTYVGLPLEEFKQIWPEAKFYSFDQGSNTETWSFSEPLVPFASLTSRQGLSSIHFYFKENKLVSYIQLGG